MNTKTLEGKVALVTGGSRGLGIAIAHALAEEGADVAITYVVSAEKAEIVARALESKGIRAAAFKSDQGDPTLRSLEKQTIIRTKSMIFV